MKECTLRYRLDCGWPVDLALGAPLNVRGSSFDRVLLDTSKPRDFGDITTKTVLDSQRAKPAAVPMPEEAANDREAFLMDITRAFGDHGNPATAIDVGRACWDAGYLRARMEVRGRV